MKTTDLVKVWKILSRRSNEVDLAVNWSAVGPVSPATARRFAKQILKAADRVEELKEQYKKKGRNVRVGGAITGRGNF